MIVRDDDDPVRRSAEERLARDVLREHIAVPRAFVRGGRCDHDEEQHCGERKGCKWLLPLRDVGDEETDARSGDPSGNREIPVVVENVGRKYAVARDERDEEDQCRIEEEAAKPALASVQRVTRKARGEQSDDAVVE